MTKRLFQSIILFLAMGIGLATGFAEIPFLSQIASVVSELFLRLLKMISLPIIFLAITSTITGMKSFHEMKKLARKTLVYTLATTIVAATIALFLYLIIQPASGSAIHLETQVAETTKQASYLSFLLNIIPSNVVQAFTENNVIGIAFLAGLLSISTLFVAEEQKNFLHKLFSSLFSAVLKITSAIIFLMPIALWAFMALLVQDLKQNFDHLSRLLLYLSCVVAANLIQGLIILPLFLKIKGISPLKAVRGMMPALTLAFFSKSSNATLPVAMNCAEQNLKVSRRISNFTLPLCSVINMNGCAAFILITVLFVSTINGITFGAFDYVSWIFFATLAAVGNAGVPMGCFFLTSAFLIGMNVPLYMMGLILPFYTVLDMIETTLNVWSDSCVTLAIDKDLAEVPALAQEEVA